MGFFIEATIGCTLTLLGYWYLSDKIFQKKSTKNWRSLLIITIYSLIITTINMVGKHSIDNIVKVIMIFVLMILFNRTKYHERISDIIIGTLIVYLNFYLAEVTAAIILSVIFEVLGINLFGIIKYSIIMNIITLTISVIIFYILKKIYTKIFRSIKYHDLALIISMFLVLIAVTILVTINPVEKWDFSIEFITTMVLIMIFCFIGVYMLKQKSNIDKVSDEYTKLAEYSQNNEGLLEEYRVNLHETKNQLIIIDNMVPKKYKEVHEYIGGLIEKSKSGKYYWLTELKYVPLPELKGFMNFKIIEMINQGLNLEINVSREINKNVFKDYKVKDKEDLYSIIGVFLDNAREASKASKEKDVSVQMYMENKNIKLIIANTYKGKIDLEKINEYGYSSKGKNRGTGLHIVNGIVNGSPVFEKETTILDNYFVQTLTIKPKQKKKKS